MHTLPVPFEILGCFDRRFAGTLVAYSILMSPVWEQGMRQESHGLRDLQDGSYAAGFQQATRGTGQHAIRASMTIQLLATSDRPKTHSCPE